MTMRTRNAGWLATASLAGAILLGGCGSAGGDNSAPALPTAEDRAQWALPLDDYIRSDSSWAISSHAENLLVSECMADSGREWPEPHVDIDSLSHPTRSAGGFRLFDTAIAGTYGYHEPSIYPPDVRATMQELNSRALTAGDQAALDGCIESAREVLPLPEYSQIGSQLANVAFEEAGDDADVKAAADSWRECMTPLGISDLPEMPDGGQGAGMPSDSQRERFALDDLSSTAGLEEIQQAVSDADCRDLSGISDAFYAAEWKLQNEALAENVDALVRDRDAVEAYMVAVRKVITDRPGS